ncbi:MAG: IS1634 family transposase [Actinomycetota bacterium]|nr:IS1634 family transposase [Actinomycetota bacterium]
MHISTTRRHYVAADGVERVYETHLLRRSVRVGKTVRNETLANLSHLPAELIEALRAGLSGKTLLVAGEGLELVRSLPHGHVAALCVQARALGLPDLLGPPCKERDIAYALVLARALRPASKRATVSWWSDTTLVEDLGLKDVGTDEAYGAMDWLLSRQDAIEQKLAERHLFEAANPTRRAYFDLSPSWMEGRCCPLAAFGHSRDAKRGKLQIEYGLLTDPKGCPVAIRVFPGNISDPTSFKEIVTVVRDRFGLTHLVMVGDRGMITSARIEKLRELEGMGWLTALRAPSIKKLAEDGGPLQMSLFDEVSSCEITHPAYPGERLVCCRNPLLAQERAAKREALLAATEAELEVVAAACRREHRPLRGKDAIALRVGKVLNHHKMAKHFVIDIEESSFSFSRNEASIAGEAALDGIYVLRTTIAEAELDTTGVILAYKELSGVERDFRSMKAIDVDMRPVHHRLSDRVRAHAFLCFLATYLTFHLRATLSPLTFTDTEPPLRPDPVAPAPRSASARKKDATKTNAENTEVRGFRELLEHLGTLTRNTMRVATGSGVTFELLATPTPTQRRAFELLGAAVPRTLL